MSLLCNQCECVNINGVRCHEAGCPNQNEKIRLGDDGTLDTVFYCANCKEEFRFNFSESGGEEEGEDAYESFKCDCLRELQDEHQCFECKECGSYHLDEERAAECCGELDVIEEEDEMAEQNTNDVAVLERLRQAMLRLDADDMQRIADSAVFYMPALEQITRHFEYVVTLNAEVRRHEEEVY